MSYETNNQEGYGLLKGVPLGEKIFTITNKLGGFRGLDWSGEKA